MKPYKLGDPVSPLPPNYVVMSDKDVTSEISEAAMNMLRDKSVDYGDWRKININNLPLIFRKETHPPTSSIPKDHIGITVYKPKSVELPTSYNKKEVDSKGALSNIKNISIANILMSLTKKINEIANNDL